MTTVIICPGASGDPSSPKLLRLAEVAVSHGFHVEIADCRDEPNPEYRIKHLLASKAVEHQPLVLVGSSMGGYVAAVAAETCRVDGLFLLSPALYLEPYKNLDPQPQVETIAIIHGLQDEIVPPDHSCRFAAKLNAQILLVDGDHSLSEKIDIVVSTFDEFLGQITKKMPNKAVDSTATRVTPPASSLRSGQESRHGQP